MNRAHNAQKFVDENRGIEGEAAMLMATMKLEVMLFNRDKEQMQPFLDRLVVLHNEGKGVDLS